MKRYIMRYKYKNNVVCSRCNLLWNFHSVFISDIKTYFKTKRK